MNYVLTFLLIICCALVRAQTHTLQVEISDPEGLTTTRSMVTDGQADKGVYNDSFRLNLPREVYKPNHALATKTVVQWGNDLPHNYTDNWTNTYQYDKQGHLVTLEYSGCMTCGRLQHVDSFEYDNNGRLVNMYTGRLHINVSQATADLFRNTKLTSFDSVTSPTPDKRMRIKQYSVLMVEHLNIRYNAQGEIISIRRYGNRGLVQEIKIVY